MGGIGKTTLVYELSRKVKGPLFRDVVIAVVSQTLNINHIHDQIVDFLRIEFAQTTKEGRASMLWSNLSDMDNVLLILDDVWNSLDLKDVGIPFGDGVKGCQVLLTTRNQHVCASMGCNKIVELNILTKDEAWSLFKQNARLEDHSSTLTAVANQVARECQGLPLPIVIVGRALRGKVNCLDWEEALDQLKKARYVNIEGIAKEIYPCLKLRYDYLKRKDHKLCFLLCSLFPEDYMISVIDLTRCGWKIGPFKEDEIIENAGRKMKLGLRTLQNSGLLMDTSRDGFVKMHDIVRDVALWIASEGEYLFMVRAGEQLDHWPPTNYSGEALKKLEILILHNCQILELLNEVGDLQNLKFLELKQCGVCNQQMMEQILYWVDLEWKHVTPFAFGIIELMMLPQLRHVCKGLKDYATLKSLKDIKLVCCSKLISLFPSSLARSLVQLQNLLIHNCDESKHIIIMEKEEGEILIECQQGPLCFLNLTKVCIHGCPKLECIFPFSVSQGLVRLEDLDIKLWHDLRLVFSYERPEGEFGEHKNRDVLLPKLENLQLRHLKNLKGFSEGKRQWALPTLTELVVDECPKFRNLSKLHKTVLLLPRQGVRNLQLLKVRNLEGERELFSDEFSGQQLLKLDLEDVVELHAIWSSHMEMPTFTNLQRIKVKGCNNQGVVEKIEFAEDESTLLSPDFL
ncbi:probable disease resistance protein At1g61190 [Rutidosis leptorrhynchoides]|uniref:probable disease resistance protein At1g61190 n=1 Tax=Rutidosis leptorrhynchoides TaxID=125765 RepID=UPI003A99A764